jgi:short-subunit dehydrogenase
VGFLAAYNLIIAARRKKRLTELAKQLMHDYGVKVLNMDLDVTKYTSRKMGPNDRY